MEVTSDISLLATTIRSANKQKSNIFTLSLDNLQFLLSNFELLEEQSTSFKTPQNLKVEFLRDLQFLNTYIRQTKTLKLYTEQTSEDTITLNKFKNVISLEFCKVDLNQIKGLQMLRPQIQKLVCHKTENSLSEVLGNCGGDKCLPYCWNELKEASFIGNQIKNLDQSLECAPWLHTLDLSHNEITNLEALNCLQNLKHLNLSFNKLEKVEQFKGQICSRLQNLILKNNFIEDISGLRSLTNLWVLDLSNNCLVNHKTLLTISHLATLQFLNLQNNPFYFHPNHRSKTASYLHTNTSTTHFILDNKNLSKQEKRLVGSYFPHQSKTCSSNPEQHNPNLEKTRRVRHVTIQESDEVVETVESYSENSRQYLETKRQIEDLHEKFGESWLNSQSGLLDVLGLESYAVSPSTSPYERDFTIYSQPQQITEEVDQGIEIVENEEYNNTSQEPEVSFEEPDVEEESIFLATSETVSDPIFLVITQNHLSERECSTSSEREKWHLESITNCEILSDKKSVKIDFETMRKDKKQRIYQFEEEIDEFVNCIQNKMNLRRPKQQVKYQCMKCSNIFEKVNKPESILVKEDILKCPSCDSTLVVEE